MAMSFDGQVAIVTGAGQGLGATYARELARRGASVVVNDLAGNDRAANVVSEIEAAGGKATVSYNNVATRDGGRDLASTAVDRYGKVDILVNNAGILRPALFEDLTDDDIGSNIGVHLEAMFYVTQAAYESMRKNGYGRVVNISSNNSFGVEGLANYSAAKAGVIGLSNTLALEAKRHGVHVNVVMPNARTDMAAESMQSRPVPRLEENTRFLSAYEAVADTSEPERPAALVTYLCSRECEYTGEIFSQVGPRYARVFFGVTQGWMSPPARPPSPEEIFEHVAEIRSLDNYTVMESMTDEYAAVVSKLQA